MKSNLISAIAGWKSAALLALVAMVAAVAFSGVLTNTADAQAAPDHTISDTATSANDVAPGDTVRLEVAGAFAQVTITGTADGVSASLSGGQSISCGDGNTCDKDTDANEVAVDLVVDADSGEGYILLSVGGLGTASQTKVINVSKTNLVGSLTITASPTTISAADGTSTLVINVKDAQATPEGQNGEQVTLVTTLGSIECVSGTETQACSVTTADSSGITGVTDGTAGYATVTLNGKGVEGTATITARLGTFVATAEVTLFGTAKNLTAEPDQDSIEIGGSVYIVLTVTDGAGNPVAGQIVTPVSSPGVEVAGPDGVEKPVLVTTEKNTAGDSTANPAVPDGRGYSKDKPAAGAAAAIPACGDDNAHIGEAAATYDELFGSDDAAGTADTGEGTNAKGQCVVYVMAPEDAADPTKNATRGAHTINFAISATVTASATIEVAGKPDSVSTDAPARVETASVTEVVVSVFDDEEVLVGITDVNIRKVGGDGLVENAGTSTTNGQTKFTFIAPSTPGSAEVLITAGAVNHRVTIAIGPEPEPVEEEPEGPAPTWSSPIVSGWNNVTWQGEDGASVADNVDDSVSSVHQWNVGSQRWNSWFSGAEGVPTTVNDFSELENGGVYWVYSE